MTDTLFSIVTVSYNTISRLEKTYESLGAQRFDSFEWIVIDAGSEDGSKSFLRTTFANWVSEPDQGIYDAMNKGIEKAQGLYILFLNAGDTLAHSDVLTDLAAYIAERDLVPDFVYGDSYEEVAGSVPIYKEARPYTKIDLGMFTHHQAMLYRREAIGDLRYNRRYRIAGDYDFTARFLRSLRYPVDMTEGHSHERDPQKRAAEDSAHIDSGRLRSATQNRLNDGVIAYFPEPICLFEMGGVSQHNTGLGRREQKFIRRNLGLCGPFKSHFITIGQSLAAFVKAAFPNFYWSLKGR